MLIKAVTLFLIGMLVMGMLGKLRMPRFGWRKKRKGIETARKCPKCGNYVLGGGPCPCAKST